MKLNLRDRRVSRRSVGYLVQQAVRELEYISPSTGGATPPLSGSDPSRWLHLLAYTRELKTRVDKGEKSSKETLILNFAAIYMGSVSAARPYFNLHTGFFTFGLFAFLWGAVIYALAAKLYRERVRGFSMRRQQLEEIEERLTARIRGAQ